MKDSLGLTKADYKRLKIQQKVGNLLNAKFTKPTYIAKFGYQRANRLCKVKDDRMKWLDVCYDILTEDFSDFLKEYTFTPHEPATQQKYIWVCWLQGEDQMPDVVKLCIRSIRKNAPEDAEVVVLSGANIRNYVDFPDYVYQNLRNGKLTLTHFSDLLRMNLLRTYGGMWIDSTVFVSRKIPQEYLEADLYGMQRWDKENRYRNIYYSCMATFLFAGSTKCMLFDFCYSFFLAYQKRYGHLIDVHPINLCFRMVYEMFPEMADAIDAIGPNNRNEHDLYTAIHDRFDEARWKELTENQIFHKLNWRKEYTGTKDGELTLYGYMQSITNE